MICLSCRSPKQAEFRAEMLIHFSGLKNIRKPGVLLFPNLTICLDCGFSRFTVPETELSSVVKDLADKPSRLQEIAGDVAFGSGIVP